MDNKDLQLVGGPCGQHGPYTFYKAFKYTKNGIKRIVTLSEFFFVKMWRDSDLLSIAELQLLWMDKNSEQVLASLRLYFLPENTPEGRLDHGEDEVLAISEKVVIRMDDLITWITTETEWSWGWLAKSERELKNVEIETEHFAAPREPNGANFTLSDFSVDFSDVNTEKKNIQNPKDHTEPQVIILSFPKYCRYRAMMKRLESVEDQYLKLKIVNALGGFYVKYPNTRVLFCKETFDYPELEGHELLCNHLAPKLKGRPRGKRKKRSVSPGSESNESESSVNNNTHSKAEIKNGLRFNSNITPRRSTRYHEHNENKEFVKKLNAFMKSRHIPIGRIPSLGYKELNLHEFFTKVQKLGGYDCVTTNRLWKSIFDDMTGNQNCTSAATVIRRHYERFLLPYERHVNGEEYKPTQASEKRRVKSKRSSNSNSASETSSDSIPTPSTSKQTLSENTCDIKDSIKVETKPSSLRSVRVKPERQKDKKLLIGDANSTSNDTKEIETSKINQTNEEFVIKDDGDGSSKHEKNDDIQSRIQSSPFDSNVDGIKEEPSSVKNDVVTELQMCDTNENVKLEPTEPHVEVTKSIKDETIAPATITQIHLADQLNFPMEGKENIPVTKSSNPCSNVNADIETYNHAQQESPKMESDAFNTSFIHEVKKRKLDILKEGGLEVTAVRSTLRKDNRPSVIQQTLPLQVSSKSIKVDVIPAPATANPRRPSQLYNATPLKIPPSTPSKKPSTNSFQFDTTPPKVLQSKSIYSYSEKTVYGNPKDILCSPTSEPVVPKFVGSFPKMGGTPVDLSVNSPQKPVIDVMNVPEVSLSIQHNRENVTKNLYKSNAIDRRKLTPNLEITLVTANRNPATFKQHNQNTSTVQQSSSSQENPHNGLPSDYYSHSKVSNSKFKTLPAHKPKHDGNGPHAYKALPGNPKLPAGQPTSQNSPGIKAAAPNLNVPGFPAYLPQLYDQPKGLSTFLPNIDPAMYYSVAFQNLYSSGAFNSSPLMQVPTQEQLTLYLDLMARCRLNPNFRLPQDGSSPFTVNTNHLKK